MEKFEYTPEVLRKLQITELQMLKEVDRICRKYDIKYIIESKPRFLLNIVNCYLKTVDSYSAL